MEEIISSLSVLSLGFLIFFFRILDVSLGTIRTIAVVEGRVKISMVLGFFELLIWITAISQLITRINDSFFLVFFYAGGFAAGNAIGILIEKKLALGTVILRIISSKSGEKISSALRNEGQGLTTFSGEGLKGPVSLLFIICNKKKIKKIINKALTIDPKLSYSVERANIWNQPYRLIPPATGWRAKIKKK